MLRWPQRCAMGGVHALCIAARNGIHAPQGVSTPYLLPDKGTVLFIPQAIKSPEAERHGRVAAALRVSATTANEEADVLPQPETNEMWHILQQIYPPLPVVYRPSQLAASPHTRLSLREAGTLLVVQPRTPSKAGDGVSDAIPPPSSPRALFDFMTPLCDLPRHCYDRRSRKTALTSVYADVAVAQEGLRCTQSKIWQLQRFAICFGQRLPAFVAIAEGGAQVSSEADEMAARDVGSAVSPPRCDRCRWLPLCDTYFAAEATADNASGTRMQNAHTALRLPCLPLEVCVCLPCLHVGSCAGEVTSKPAGSALRRALLQAERELASCTWFAAHADPALSRVHRVWSGEAWCGEAAALDAAHEAVLRAMQRNTTDRAILPHAWVPPYWHNLHDDDNNEDDDQSQVVLLPSGAAQSWTVGVTRTWWLTPLQLLLDARRLRSTDVAQGDAKTANVDSHASLLNSTESVPEQLGNAAAEVTEFELMSCNSRMFDEASYNACARRATPPRREDAELHFPPYHGPTGLPILHDTIHEFTTTPSMSTKQDKCDTLTVENAIAHAQTGSHSVSATQHESRAVVRTRRRLCWFAMRELRDHGLSLTPTNPVSLQRTSKDTPHSMHKSESLARPDKAPCELHRSMSFTGFFLDDMPWWFVRALTTSEVTDTVSRVPLHKEVTQILLHDYPVPCSDGDEVTDKHSEGTMVYVLRCAGHDALNNKPKLAWTAYNCAGVEINTLYQLSEMQSMQGTTTIHFIDVRAAMQVMYDRNEEVDMRRSHEAETNKKRNVLGEYTNELGSYCNASLTWDSGVHCQRSVQHWVDYIIAHEREQWSYHAQSMHPQSDNPLSQKADIMKIQKSCDDDEALTVDSQRVRRVQEAFEAQLKVVTVEGDDSCNMTERPAVDRRAHKPSERLDTMLREVKRVKRDTHRQTSSLGNKPPLKVAITTELKDKALINKIMRAVQKDKGQENQHAMNKAIKRSTNFKETTYNADSFVAFNKDDTELGRYNRRIVPWLKYFSTDALNDSGFMVNMLPCSARHKLVSKSKNDQGPTESDTIRQTYDIGLQHIKLITITQCMDTSQLQCVP